MKEVMKLKRDQVYYLAIFYFIVDQFSKALVLRQIDLFESIKIIPGFFQLTYVQNRGAAWGILANHTYLFVLFGAGAFFIINRFLGKKKNFSRMEGLGYGLLLAGIMGNLIDRLLRDYVVDFLDFHFFGYHFPVFNFADIGVVIGVLMVVIVLIKQEKKGEEKHEIRKRSRERTN